MNAARISPADTAELIRAALKRSFPRTKFSVRTDKYARGASVDVFWTDGPAVALVERVIGPFAGSGSGVDHVAAVRSYSDAFTARVLAKMRRDGFEWTGDEGPIRDGWPMHAGLCRLVHNEAVRRIESPFDLLFTDALHRVRHAFMVAAG